MDFKAVLFDLDGTLLNTIDDLADSMNAVLKRSNFPIHEVDKYKYFVGEGIYNLVARALPFDNEDKELTDSYLAAFREEYQRRMVEKTRPYPEIPELLNSLKHQGLSICILSNKPHAATKFVASRLLGQWSFDAVYGERPDVPRKPDPSAALEIADIIGIKPEHFLYLGDSGVDMRTASDAGMYGVGALWGFRSARELEENGAKLLIQRPLELLELL